MKKIFLYNDGRAFFPLSKVIHVKHEGSFIKVILAPYMEVGVHPPSDMYQTAERTVWLTRTFDDLQRGIEQCIS